MGMQGAERVQGERRYKMLVCFPYVHQQMIKLLGNEAITKIKKDEASIVSQTALTCPIFYYCTKVSSFNH